MAIGNPTPAHGRALLALPLVLLAACGGGGAAPNPPTGQGGPAPVRAGGSGSNLQTAPCFRTFDGGCLSNGEFTSRSRSLTAEFNSRRERDFTNTWGDNANAFLWPLERINLDKAQAHLSLARGSGAANAPGRGVTIGFLDSGIHKQHEAFDRTSSVTEDFFLSAVNESSNEFSHGTAVASVAAGKYGIAYGAGVKMFAIPLSDPPDPNDPYNPITLNQLSTDDFQFAQLSEQVLGQGIDILNLSVALRGGIEDYGEQDLRNNYGRTIQALAQSGKQDKTILVWAAGNDGKKPEASPSSPAITAGLPARIEELQGHSIAVVSIGQDGDISDFSNRCGIARDFCIAAPGENVGAASLIPSRRTSRRTGWSRASGTSFAAPMVSGSLAVMKQLFRGQLSNEELVSRLFATADKQGIYGNQAIYGQGLLDLGAATNPWGTTGFMRTGSTTSGSGAAPITTTSLTAGPALGDSLSQALDSREVATFDSLGAPFWFDAGAFTGEGPGVTVAARLQEALHPLHRQPIPETWQFHLQGNATAHPYGHLALAHGASRLTVAGPQGVSASLFQAPERLQGMALSWHPPSIPALSFTAGHLQEHDTLLGSHAKGAFGRFSAATTFLGATLNTTAGRWQLSAAGEIGTVQPSLAASSLIDHVSPLTTSAFRLQASKTFDNGHGLSLSLAQPLRVDQGAASFSLPTGRTGDGVVTGASFSSPLTPSGRQLDLTTTVEMPLAGGDLSLGVTGSFQPRHQQSTAAEWIFFTGYRTTW